MKKEKCVDDSNSEMFVCSSHFVNGKPSDPNPNSEVPNKREGGLNKRVSEWGYGVGWKII